MTKEKNKEWLIAILLVAFSSTHLYSYVYWPEYKSVNIYYISLYSMFYALSTALSFLARHKALKVVVGLILSGSGYCLYLEFAGDPKDWSLAQRWIGAFVLLNGLMFTLIIEKLKK
jgi:hypothetical protein